MIGLKELCALLDSLGIPWASQSFGKDDEPEPPFICLVAGFTETVWADNAAYCTLMDYDIALYTRHRDYTTEKRIADALAAAGCTFEKSVTAIANENLTEAAFSVKAAEY